MIIFIKHIKEEGPGLLGEYFSSKGYDVLTVDLSEGETLPDKFEHIQAVVSMGGPMNVYEEDKYPFLIKEDLFLKEIIENKIPFLGVCLGAQLLAKAAGAKIIKSPIEEIGFYDIALSEEGENDALFRGIDKEVKVFQWHGDMFNIPIQAVHLAGNSNCVNQAFKIGVNAYGLQFHIEADRDMILDWMKDRYKGNPSGFDRFKQEIDIKLPAILKTGQKICRNFEQVILQP